MLVPIAPHLSFGNAVVFDPDQRIELDVRDAARISIDGQEEHDLAAGDRIAVRVSETVRSFVRTSHARPSFPLPAREDPEGAGHMSDAKEAVAAIPSEDEVPANVAIVLGSGPERARGRRARAPIASRTTRSPAGTAAPRRVMPVSSLSTREPS